jgi:phosphoglycolate phosphatase
MFAVLKSAGINTAIITNKHGPTGMKICDTLFGTDGRLLDECVSAYPGMKLKPAPDEIWRLLEKYKAKRDECIYCGDHTIDMETGKNAGVITVGVTWGFHTRESLISAGADFIAGVPDDIVELVNKINTGETE